MKRSYSHDFTPPAPMVGVMVAAPAGRDEVSLEGKLDSGADICALPESVIAALDLPPVREVRAAGFTGELQPTLLYRCALEIAGERLEGIEALATRRHYAIVGRNVMSRLVVKLDGPQQQLTLAIPTPKRRRRRSIKTKKRR